MNLKRGDVAIAMFPNADGSPPKPRPVLVVQSDLYNTRIKNLIVAAITSNLKHTSDPATLLIEVSTTEGKATGLRQNSLVSCINVATIEDTLIVKKIGQFSIAMMQKINNCLKISLELP
ncbi:MAG TPA: type II toxin-antitoxin system PemK/MazF family toxin [Gemmata sp.]|jgi:mRNA interferase MazF|nr:type II toxin-antitoxin system PemK/MazF family toxin [Gemmata sp.]